MARLDRACTWSDNAGTVRMKMRRRIALAVIVLAALTGCGSGKFSSNTPTTQNDPLGLKHGYQKVANVP